MPHSASAPRALDELLLVASDVSVVDRATLSLWHFQQLLRRYLPTPSAAATGEKTPETEDKENSVPSTALAAPLLPSVELEDGMSVAAVAFEEGLASENAHKMKELDPETEDANDVVRHASMALATKVSVIYKRYRCVLSLDASPSSLAIDLASGKVFLDMLYESAELFVRSLLRPVEVGGIAFVPEFHVSVMVQGALIDSLCVLVQGFVLDASNADRLLSLVRQRLTLLEDEWAAAAASAIPSPHEDYTAQSQRANLSSMLQNAVFALNSLPSGAAPLLVLATDGVVDLFNTSSYDNLIMQLVRHDVQCHFIRVGGHAMNDPNASFGFVPDVDLLQFVADASGGAVVDYLGLHEACWSPARQDRVKSMTSFQSSLLVRPSKLQAIATPVLKLDTKWCASFDGGHYRALRPYRIWREKVHEYRIHADVDRIIEARIREGFLVNKLHIRNFQRLPDGSLGKMPPVGAPAPAVPSEGPPPVPAATKVLLVCVLQWKQNVWLEYVISSTIEHQSQGRSTGAKAANARGLAVSGTAASLLAQLKKDFASSEWYVKVNVLADAEFLRAFEDTRTGQSVAKPQSVGARNGPAALHEFIRNVQDVDRVLLHLMTAAATVVTATDVSSQFSFGTQASASLAAVHTTNKTQLSIPVFGIIGDLSPVLWHRWFHVDRFEVLSVVIDEPSPEVFYPRADSAPKMSRTSVVVGQPQYRNIATGRTRVGRRGGMPLEANLHPLMVETEHSVDRVRAAIFKWSSQKMGKDLYLRFLASDSQRTDDRGRLAGNTVATTPVGAAPVAKRRQQRSSLNSATISAQIATGLEQQNQSLRREETAKGALCFVRVEVKNRTLVVVHVAFYSCSALTRRETLAELKSIVTGNDVNVNSPGVPTHGGIQSTASASASLRKLVLCHRMISRLLVTHDSLVLEGTDLQEKAATPSRDLEQPLVACCGGSELQLRSVFGAFMWHSSWKWRLVRSNTAALTEVMRHLHEARLRSGFWVLDWKLEEDGDGVRVSSVIFGREILMEDENGHLKTSLIQYGVRRTPDNCLLTSFWMEPQYGFAKRTMAGSTAAVDRSDTFHWALRHAIGHEVSLDESEQPSDAASDSPVDESATYLDEAKLLQLIRECIFDTDRHVLSCLHTFETLTTLRENSLDANMQATYSTTLPTLGLVGIESTEDERPQETSIFVPAFSTARLLDASTRSTEHFLMYLERSLSTTPEGVAVTAPTLSSANLYLYSMLERTLRSLSDCEVAWTDYHGDLVSEKPGQASGAMRTPATTSKMPQWFVQSARRAAPRHQPLSLGRCFAKLLPNDTVVLAFLPDISVLETRKRSLLSPVHANQGSQSKMTTLSRWDHQHQLKASASLDVGESTSTSSESVLKMSVSADDIVLYQERRQSFREGYKSWRMGHFQGAKDDKSHNAGHGAPLSPHPKVASFSEDYEFCDSQCREADLGCDFHLLIEKADGVLGSGYFQVAFYECSLTQLSSALTTQLVPSGEDASYQALLGQLFIQRAAIQRHDQATEPNDRVQPVNKMFGNRPGSHLPPPSPVTVTQQGDPNDESSELAARHSSMSFRKKVKRAHEHNFSRGVYVALRDGSPVQQSDLIQALSSCVEVPMDLDITLLYRMLQVDMIRETVPRSALRSSMIDLLSGKSIRDALKERLDKCVEQILATLFLGIEDTKYFFFVGNENMAIDDVVGVADTENDGVQILVEEEDSSAVDSQPPRLVKSVTIATDAQGFGETLPRRTDLGDGETDAMVTEVEPEDFKRGEVFAEELQEQQQINQEEDAELNKDVAAATSSFSSPFFFRFESREIAQDREVRSRSTSSGASMVKPLLPPPSRPSLQRSSSSKSFLDTVPSAKPSTPASLPIWQRKALTDSITPSVTSSGVTGGVSEIAEWAASATGPKIALRLVTLTLPNEQLLERTRSHPTSMDVHDKRQRPTAAELFSSLPFFQRQVLKQIRKSLKEWSSLEILRILRSVETITPAVALLVQKLFSQLPASCITKVKYPVDFVNVHHETLDPVSLLEKELKLGTESLRLVECGGLYFVANKRDDGSCDVPYWAFLKVQGDHIELQLHHPSLDGDSNERQSNSEWFDRLTVLTALHIGVNAICKRVNQYLLLLQLHETRSCNEFLLPVDPGTGTAGPPSPTSSSAVASQTGQFKRDPPFFWPGQFACDLKYAAFFGLNDRMVPSIALTTLCTQALEQFQVHNRRHVFVYRDRGGHVFYIKMSTAASDVVMQAKQSVLRHIVGSVGSSSSTGILLEVFGVCEPGDEVTQELCKLLERKLDETMQLILMKLLARNTKFQLSASDMTFMCPPGGDPAASTVYTLPSGLVPPSDASTLLLFLCQTLGMTSYIRQMNATQVSLPSRFERQSSNSRALVELPMNSGPSSSSGAVVSADLVDSTTPDDVPHDATVTHPATFSRTDVELMTNFDATTTSPVFFTSVPTDEPSPDEVSVKREAVVLGEATFAINLNSELRLSPGFLARVGKGLAVLRVEVLESDSDVADEGEDITELLLRVPMDNSVASDAASKLFVRCQMWIRGPIQVPAFRDVYEAHLKEALYDYAIETEIRTVRREQKAAEEEAGKVGGARLPRRIKSLVDLLEAATRNMSSSVTKLALPLAVPSWDIDNIVTQVTQFLRVSLPIHARPAVYVSKGSEFFRVEVEDLRIHKSPRIKLVPMPVLSDAAGSSNTLIHSDSIQSDLSDVDSVASFRQSMSSSTIESLTTASLHASSSSSIAVAKEYSTSELMFYSMAKGASAESVKVAGTVPLVQQRTFYFVLDVSTTHDGVTFYGYNLSHQVLDAIALQLSKVMTWSLLRGRMLRCLLLQRGGVAYASPNGAPVVQPRSLLVGGAGGRSHPGGEFTVSFVDFRSKIVPILQAFGMVPKTIETITRQDVSAFARLLKEFGIQVSDGREPTRSRTTSSASSTRLVLDESATSRPGATGLRAMGGIVSASNSSSRTLGGDKLQAKTNSSGTTVPSPTKRPSAGSHIPPMGLGGPSAGNTGNQGPGNAARMRANPTAANALMAARARARGGGFPGKMGPGIGSNRGAAAGEVAPWDLPVANAKGNTPASATKMPVPTPIQQPPALGRMGSADFKPTAPEVKRMSASSSSLVQATSAASSTGGSRTGSSKNPWRKILAETWGPRYKYCPKNTFVEAVDKTSKSKMDAKSDSGESARVGGKAVDPLRHFGSAFLRREQSLLACTAASDSCLTLYRRIKQIMPQQEHSIEGARETTVRSMLGAGHLLYNQRFRVSYIERWEVVKIEEEYLSDGSNTGRLRALQASMDLVNLLSYKQEFVFHGNECVVAKLLTEHTVQAMTGKEGQAVREMKLQILKAVFHSRMEVVHRFVDQYAVHLRALGFYHLRLPSSRLGRKHHADTAAAGGSSSASASGSATPTRASAVDAFAAEGEAYSEFFVHSGSLLRKTTATSRAGAARSGSRAVPDATNDVLILELKCDHSGVQLSVILLNEQDLQQQELGHQRHLQDTISAHSTARGEMVNQVTLSLRGAANTRGLIHDFTIRFFHQCLLDWTLLPRPDVPDAAPLSPASASSLHNMVKGIRCFLRTYPRGSLAKSSHECALEATAVELPVRNLQSDFSESILMKILLRYIGCHGSRYEVTDLTQFGTPDTVACHSSAGNFYNRQTSMATLASINRGGGTAVTNKPGYSLLITTQELWKGKKRPKNSVLLVLIRSVPLSSSTNVLLLPIERAMQEAELFVKELFRAAAANYERDLLWSRLLYSDAHGVATELAQSLALPIEHFRFDVGPQQLEECLRLSVCIPLQTIDPELSELLAIDDVCWQEFALRLRDVYAGQVREYQFEGHGACHFLLLCPDARDLMIHLTFPSGIASASLEGEGNRVHIDICRREEPASHKFSLPQRRAITDFVNTVVHWLWRCLLYD